MRDRAADDMVTKAFWAAVPLLLMLAFTKLMWWSVPLGIYVDGAIQGLLLSFVSLGFVLVYRSNRAINFSAAELGATPAAFAFLLWASLGWNLYLSIAIGLVSAVVLGVLVEFLFLRIFFNSPRLIFTVATIGVTQLLVALGFFLAEWLGQPDNNQYPPIFHGTMTISGAVFDGNDLMVLIVTPVVLIGLACFFRWSATGVALRATAENADRASLLGIPTRRLQSVVWGLAALLAFIGMFMRIGVVGLNIGEPLDAALLVAALGAAVIGRMERMPTTVLAAVGLSIVSHAADAHYSALGVQSTFIVAVIICVALLLQRTDATNRLMSAATASWQATREIKPIPAELRREQPVRRVRGALWVLLAVVVLLIGLLSDVRVELAGTIGIFAIIALSLVVLTGWAGQVSLGQMAFVGVAAAVAGTIATRWHWDIGLLLLAGGLAGAAVTILVGLPTLRVGGLAFAITTLAFAEATIYLFNSGYGPLTSWVPQEVPRTHLFGVVSVESETRFYYLIMVVLVLSIWMTRGLRRSRIGRVLIGARDNERAAQAYAVGTHGARIIAFGVSGFLAGMAGALYVLQQKHFYADDFNVARSLQVFAMVVVGGLGSIGGAILGAVYIKGVQYFLIQPEWAFLSSGVGILVVLMIFPAGIGAALGDARDGILRWYARKHDIRVPSLVADTLAKEPPAETTDLIGALAEGATEVEVLAEVHE